MATPHDLTTSGLLYYGNYEAWKLRVDAILRLHGFQSIDDIKPGGDRPDSPFGNITRQQLASHLIRSQVSPKLLEGITPSNPAAIEELFTRLRRLTTPFRFLDLSAELRNRVYELAVDNLDEVTLRPRQASAHQFPAITKVSRQVREEVLPVLYKRATFHFNFRKPPSPVSAYKSLYSDGRVGKDIHLWAKRSGASLLKRIEEVALTLKLRLKDTETIRTTKITFTLTPDRGLLWSASKTLQPSSKIKLDKHVAAIERNRTLFSLRGEALILVLTSRPKFWEYGGLKLLK